MSDNIRSITFAAILCLVCAVLLTAASSGLKELQLKNIAVDKHKNILKAVGLLEADQKYSSSDIEKLYADAISSVWVDAEGNLLKESKENTQQIFLFKKLDKIEAYVVPLNTKGLWGKIKGYLAMESDGVTVAGFTVFSHAETPGLGAEIASPWFQQNFVGKKIVNKDGKFVSVWVAKGKAPQANNENYVDGISGATLTGNFLAAGIKDTLAYFEPMADKFRKGAIN
jgi:Na+-transporting NADH:ubiquinone oxidoreductase subunit C